MIYDVRSSLKELSRAATSKIEVERFGDNPRRLGKGQTRLVGLAPLIRLKG